MSYHPVISMVTVVHFRFFSADFFQLLFVCLQWYMFRLENGSKEHLDNYAGGSNEDILDKVEAAEANPVEDFLSYKE